MNTAPALILQMQRMGDIVLSFPLFLWLRRNHPERAIWVVAEPTFYESLLKVSPAVTYLPWTATGELEARDYSLIVNLSHRPEAADLTGRLSSGLKLGPVREGDGLHVRGRWQLYRAALTGNNRHNRFHWAELNALDCVDKGCFPATAFSEPRELPERASVGLFLGASQEEKRPPAAFWAALAVELERRGLKVMLLGGPGEVALGREVSGLHGGKLVDTCGKLSLHEFMAVGQTLSLLVTPDTGPMHLAAWSGLKVLNLSMGPVNPWETGPFPPGHFVLRAGMACLDCWRCRFETPHCRARFDPGQTAYLAWRLVRSPGRAVAAPGMRLYRTGRTAEGFYDLIAVGQGAPRASEMLGEFWRGYFGYVFGLWQADRPRASWEALSRAHPRLGRAFARGMVELARRFKGLLLTARKPGDDFWADVAPMERPLAGYMHMYMENEDYSRSSLAHCLELIGRVRSLTA